MAVKLRLIRFGRKKKPFYRIVAMDSRDKRDGQYIDKIGIYDPLRENNNFKIDEEKTLKWLLNGAIPTDTVRSMLSKVGIMKRFHEEKQLKKKKDVEAE
ncbi:MAG: 30S ribosomal protein S16 [Deferribacterota bacterium]|nr:30S ribosomal protein S16 [Deferribacterota bacterium]